MVIKMKAPSEQRDASLLFTAGSLMLKTGRAHSGTRQIVIEH